MKTTMNPKETLVMTRRTVINESSMTCPSCNGEAVLTSYEVINENNPQFNHIEDTITCTDESCGYTEEGR